MWLLNVLFLVALLGAPALAQDKAEFDWSLQCRGCHGATGENSRNDVPALAGEVAKFLSVEGGRAFLVQVPGVANAPLSDQRLADVTNWMLRNFDGANIPSDFVPYEAHEVGQLRKQVLGVEVSQVRQKLRRQIEANQASVTNGVMDEEQQK